MDREERTFWKCWSPASRRHQLSRPADSCSWRRFRLKAGLQLPCLIAAVLLAAPAYACRYNIREIGFVDAEQPKFRFAVFVHGDDHKDWLPGFQRSATRILGGSNVSWEIVDEVVQASSPDLRYRAMLGPRLPGGMVLAPTRDDGWPVYLHVPPDELDAKLSSLVRSRVRAQIVNAVIETYGAVLMLRGLDETANDAARRAANEAIKVIEASLADLPKRIERGPRVIELDPSLPDEQVIAWSLGVNGKDLPRPVAAVVYGRGRLAGAPLQGETLTATKLRDQLSLIGADCECTLDHAWMSAGSLPLAISAADESRITAALGFDPAAAAVKAEVHHILQTQALVAADPAARTGAGYRETPLEIVPIAPGLPQPRGPAAAAPSPGSTSPGVWWIAAGVGLAVIVWCAVRTFRRRAGA